MGEAAAALDCGRCWAFQPLTEAEQAADAPGCSDLLAAVFAEAEAE